MSIHTWTAYCSVVVLVHADGRGGPSETRIMQPWSKMRSVETRIRGALSQARHGSSNDVASHLAVVQVDGRGALCKQSQP